MGEEGEGGEPSCACEEGLNVKRGDDSSETCFDIVPYKGNLPSIGNIVFEGSPPPSAHTCSSRRPTVGKPKPFVQRPSTNAPPSSKTRGSKRNSFPPPSSATIERRVYYL